MTFLEQVGRAAIVQVEDENHNPIPGAAVLFTLPGSGPSGLPNDFDCGTVERSVGIRMVSWVGGSISWRFSPEK